GSALVRPVQTGCGETSETTVASARLQIATSVSDQQATVGAQIHDTVVVSGLGSLSVPVTVDLWGPFAGTDAIRCTGTPAWTGTFTARGDGTYQTAPVTLTVAGYYTYRERIEATGLVQAVQGPCGAATETTVARARPQLATQVSDQQ